MRMIAALGVLVLLAAGFFVFAVASQRQILFPAPPLPAMALPEVAGLERIQLPSGVEAFLLPAHDAPAPAPVVVFAHGNGELIDHWAPWFEPMRAWGLAVLLVEYPGYGRSAGSPSEASIGRAMQEALTAAAERPALDAERWIAYGRSLGGGAVLGLAARHPPAAVILESTFTSVPALATRLGVPGFLIRDRFDNASVLAGLERPTLIVHGMRDTLIPFAHATALADVRPGARLEVLDCGHNDCPRPWPQIHAFLVEHDLVVER